jgi:2-haloacid dehalogenase
MTDFQDIQACVFDAYGTLFDIHSPTARVADRLGDKAQAISDLWRAKQLQYSLLRSLMHVHADFWQVTGDALDYALAVFEVPDPDLRERLMELYLSLDAYRDAVPALEQLAGDDRRCAILSNGAPAMLQASVENAGLAQLLEAVISVEDAGIYKPAPQVYQLAIDRMGVAKENICFVSSNAWDVAGAAQFGLQVAHLNRFGQPIENIPGKPKAVITDLGQLPGLLN